MFLGWLSPSLAIYMAYVVGMEYVSTHQHHAALVLVAILSVIQVTGGRVANQFSTSPAAMVASV